MSESYQFDLSVFQLQDPLDQKLANIEKILSEYKIFNRVDFKQIQNDIQKLTIQYDRLINVNWALYNLELVVLFYNYRKKLIILLQLEKKLIQKIKRKRKLVQNNYLNLINFMFLIAKKEHMMLYRNFQRLKNLILIFIQLIKYIILIIRVRMKIMKV